MTCGKGIQLLGVVIEIQIFQVDLVQNGTDFVQILVSGGQLMFTHKGWLMDAGHPESPL